MSIDPVMEAKPPAVTPVGARLGLAGIQPVTCVEQVLDCALDNAVLPVPVVVADNEGDGRLRNSGT